MEKLGIKSINDRLNILDPWGNRIEIVPYDDCQFTKAANILKGMAVDAPAKTANAIEELKKKGMATAVIGMRERRATETNRSAPAAPEQTPTSWSEISTPLGQFFIAINSRGLCAINVCAAMKARSCEPERKRSSSARYLTVLIWTALSAVYLIWGSTYLAIRFTVETSPPFLSAAARFIISGAVLYLWRRLCGDADAKPTRMA